MLIAFADWVGAIVSFDFGQVGSPECALPGDAETALLAKFLLTVCIAQSSLECRNSVLFLVDSFVYCVLQHAGFVLMCAILTVPELTAHCRSEAHRTLHAINVRSGLSSVTIVLW